MNTSVFSQSPGFPCSVHTAPSEISAYDAARLMAWRKVGVVIVVRDHQPIGIVTDRDLTTRVLGNGLDARTIKIGRVMTSPVVVMKTDEPDDHILAHMLRSRVRQIPLVDGTGQLIGLAALDVSGEGGAGTTIVRSTVLVPMIKRKRWRRLVFRLKQDVASNLRWIGATVALAAVGGVVSLIAVGYWTPWTSPKVATASQTAPHSPDAERSAESTKLRFAEPGPAPSFTK